MYQDNTSHIISAASTSAVGVAALPATGGNTMLMIAAYMAIGLGAVVLMLQLGVSVYRSHMRKQ
jgi:hypothetical protein